jgi:16S rRNA (adenine1518-N6/adenine1519-N6)-dimethyltransferase
LPPPRHLLERYGLRPKYSFGQNFLSDPRLLQKVADAITTGLDPADGVHILELGAGLGALTSALLEQGFRVTAIERDRDLMPVLSELFVSEISEGRLRLVEADAKTADYEELLAGSKQPVLAGNLPYQITGPLLEKAITSPIPWQRVVFLVQKEVADRLVAAPGSAAYGALSVYCQARFRPERALVLSGGAFYPPPRVDSALVRLVPHAELVASETPLFRQVVSLAFAARRKTLRNAWKGLAPADELARASNEVGISLDARGETLGVESFAALTRALAARAPAAEGAASR